MKLSYNELYKKHKLLEEENKRLKNEVISLRMLLSGERTGTYDSTNSILDKEANSDENNNLVTMYSSNKDKIELFKSLFKGRADVCAKRWRNKPGYSPYCFNDFKTGLCAKPKIKCNVCKNSDFAPLDDERIKNHLLGKYVLGLYPMTVDDTCYFLAMDFDETTWIKDTKIVLNICNKNNSIRKNVYS